MLRILPRCTFQKCLSSSPSTEFDLIVIGGGSGGLACSKAAQSFGARVALVNSVVPTPSGISWGLGGTCANVGCIPKKLFHQAGIVGREISHATHYGWSDVVKGTHNWEILRRAVSDRIKANNWIYRVQLNQMGIKFYNAFASFVNKNTVKIRSADKIKYESILQAPMILIATGLRPRYPDIPGAQLGITSDDMFSLPKQPGKTLVVGGSYVALESAGLLANLGCEVQLLIRSEPLKFFDKDCVNHVMESLEKHGVKITYHKMVQKVELDGDLRKVTFHSLKNEIVDSEHYNTVLWAIGRSPLHSDLQLDKVDVRTSINSGKIIADDLDRTTAENIYAIGDIVEGRPELTPPAIRAGKLLAARLFGRSRDIMNYSNIPTTIFTPLELGSIGDSEENAINIYGESNIEVYHTYFTPYEYIIPQDPDSAHCYAKIVCMRAFPRDVLGIHIVGPNAAEIIQGYAVALRKGITFDDLIETTAIHPCTSEEFVNLSITKRSGIAPTVQGCCG